MVIISAKEFRDKQKIYFDLAETERVIIKRGKKMVELVVRDKISDNPSPSGDTWFENSENLAHALKGIEQANEGKTKHYTRDELRTLLQL